MTHVADQSQVLTELDQQVMADLQLMQETVSTSQELLELGAQDQLASMIVEMRTKPMLWLVRSLSQLGTDLQHMVAAMAVRFFAQKKDLLRSVFIVKSEGLELNYVLVPKVDDMNTQFELNEFLSAYLQTQFWQHVPVNFHVVPAELAGDLVHVESVSF